MSSLTIADTPKCVAETGDAFNETIQNHNATPRPDNQSNVFRQAQFSPDGTTIIARNEDQCLRSFLLPPHLLANHDIPLILEPYSTLKSGPNIQSYTSYPHYDLQDSSTTLVLCGHANLPITLRNALDFGTVHAHYTLQHPGTEEFLAPRSLAFTSSGDHFIVGSDNVLAIFNTSRSGEGPVAYHKLRPGKRAPQTTTWRLSRRGLVSAMSMSSEGLLALGTTEREVAIYDEEGQSDCLFVFDLDPGSGSGVTDLKWSPDGRHLLVAQRQSDVVDVYDIRGTHQKVGSLTGRNAGTPQRIGVDVVPTASGYELWAGGTDGCVRMWTNPGRVGGNHAPDADFKLHDSCVSSAVWHPSGAVLATCSGDRSKPDSDDIDAGVHDNKLKIWTLS